ncbi:MAG: aminoacyl-tRNA hydrolase [Holosporaceae bacterium]|jgi:PTH1 family peptidyl-tRNA hydrolase|nr:aminoacyl-tRNA hydrolase [Holosporaceae bacterium]
MEAAVLLVGLGNPGPNHENNRHNLGFRVVNEVAGGGSFKKIASLAEIAVLLAGDRKIILSKPCTFMNLSGNAVKFLVDFYKIPDRDVYVVHDDIDLEPGRVKIKKGGGNGGHNGLKSIDGLIGTDYWRVRVGIGRPPEKYMISSYVLGDFTADEEVLLHKIIGGIKENLPLLFSDGKKLEQLLNFPI